MNNNQLKYFMLVKHISHIRTIVFISPFFLSFTAPPPTNPSVLIRTSHKLSFCQHLPGNWSLSNMTQASAVWHLSLMRVLIWCLCVRVRACARVDIYLCVCLCSLCAHVSMRVHQCVYVCVSGLVRVRLCLECECMC